MLQAPEELHMLQRMHQEGQCSRTGAWSAPASTNVLLIVPDLYTFYHKPSMLPRLSVPEIAGGRKGSFSPSLTE